MKTSTERQAIAGLKTAADLIHNRLCGTHYRLIDTLDGLIDRILNKEKVTK